MQADNPIHNKTKQLKDKMSIITHLLFKALVTDFNARAQLQLQTLHTKVTSPNDPSVLGRFNCIKFRRRW